MHLARSSYSKMDTGDPVQDDAPKTAAGGKGKKKKKEGKKTLTLDQFLAQDDGYSEPKSQNWAILTENQDDDYDAPMYKFDRSTLPTAPKAALGPKVDLSQIPRDGPFSAYVGNIPYDAKESDLAAFFQKLDVDTVRIIYDGGRPKGYAYVDFKTRESLLDALTYHEKEYMGRTIRVDLATEKNQDGRGGRAGEPDRTEGDWRRRNPAADNGSSFRDSERGGRYGERDRGYSDRDRGGGGGFDRERGGGGFSDRSFGDRDRGFGDRDRDRGSYGGDRERDRGFSERDRGYGGERDRGFGGERDRGYGNDRDRGFSDRERGYGGDRDRGYGGDRDRGYGSDRDRGYGGERSSRGYGFNRDSRDRDDGGRFGSRGGGGGGAGGYDDRYGSGSRRDDYNRGRKDDNFDRRPTSRDVSPDHRDAQRERPVLNLKPRSKPVENKENQPASRSSIFGAAKPVDTAAREREIEEKLKKKDEVEHSESRTDSQQVSKRRDSETSDHGWRSGERYGDHRRESADGSAPVSRRDSEHSRTSDDGVSNEETVRSPTTASKPADPAPKMVPAPPPKENPWVKKKDSGASLSSSSNTSDVSNNATVSSPTPPHSSDKRDGQQPKPSVGGRGRGGEAKSDSGPGKRSAVDKSSGSHNGPSGRKSDSTKARPPKEKALPKRFEDMPKYEDTKAKDFSDRNKFAFLVDDESEEQARRDRGEEDESHDIAS